MDTDQYSAKETARRRDEAIRRALNTPFKPQSESKLGKPRRKGPVIPKNGKPPR